MAWMLIFSQERHALQGLFCLPVRWSLGPAVRWLPEPAGDRRSLEV